ncbi:cell division protein FtsQ [Geomicrobium halophilum]|uniref:Cell division protein DivIB n=1 Tax=Geomicrobium halophilum TaxID=549000 RepID=A0A841PXW3_9BACL|nr:FtsQ-type POTRA domain-containing protein [Geomicrobium halophilum]MBB6449383.1 cell division protein FtsQ [Geomicrobium halophilum]
MGDRKVVSVHDRIPALREQRKKRANRRVILTISTFFLLIGIVVYFQSPLSHIRSIEVDGVVTGEEGEVTVKSGLTTGESIWAADLNSAESGVEELPYVMSASISRSFPTTLHIDVQERERVAYLEENGSFVPVYANGESMPDQSLDQLPGDAPILYGWEDKSQLDMFLSELEELEDGVANHISEVHPVNRDNDVLRLYMNDGIEVETYINNFAEYMSTYSLVAEELNSSEPGILHMKMSPYFETFANPEEEEENGEEEENTEA